MCPVLSILRLESFNLQYFIKFWLKRNKIAEKEKRNYETKNGLGHKTTKFMTRPKISTANCASYNKNIISNSVTFDNTTFSHKHFLNPMLSNC